MRLLSTSVLLTQSFQRYLLSAQHLSQIASLNPRRQCLSIFVACFAVQDASVTRFRFSNTTRFVDNAPCNSPTLPSWYQGALPPSYKNLLALLCQLISEVSEALLVCH